MTVADVTRTSNLKDANVGMVYQDCALFPHLSVAENILFGLKVRRQTRTAMKKALSDIALAGAESDTCWTVNPGS